MSLFKYIFLFLFISLNCHGLTAPSGGHQQYPWVVKLRTQYKDELNNKNVDLVGAGTLFKFSYNGTDRWFVLTVAHVTQGLLFDAFAVDVSGKPIYKFNKVSSSKSKTGINEAVDHLSDVHIFEVKAPPATIIKNEGIPVIKFKGVVQGQNLFRIYLPEESYKPQENNAIATELTIPHLSWVRENGFATSPSEISQKSSPYALRFYWTAKEYSVDSRVVHGMSGLPSLTFDVKSSMWVVLGVIKSFHLKRMETYIVSDRAISSVFESVVYGGQANPNQEGVTISWRYRSPFGTYRYFSNKFARFSEISSFDASLSMEKAGGHETSDGGGHETSDGGGHETSDGGGHETSDGGGHETSDGGGHETSDGGGHETSDGGGHETSDGGKVGKTTKPDQKIKGPELTEWQWSYEKNPKNIGVLSLPVPEAFKGLTTSKRIWISSALRSLEFIGIPEIFENSSILETHSLNEKTLRASFNERIKPTTELYLTGAVPNFCQISWEGNSDTVKIKLNLPYHRDFIFAKNENNAYNINVSLKKAVDNNFILSERNMQLNIQGLFFFDPINSYAPSPKLALEQAFNYAMISYVVLKDNVQQNHRTLNLPCISFQPN